MTGFKLEEGVTIHVKFTNTNSASNPKLKFNIAEPVKSANELFKDFGLPSRFQRWCTPILKTAKVGKKGDVDYTQHYDATQLVLG